MTKKNNPPISGGKAVVECLKANNVKHVFGLIGSATMELFDALYDEKSIKFIDVRDERTGAHMADAYARASGNHGVIIAGQNGPGATNLVTGVAQAKAAFSPLLSIAGAIATEHKGKDAFQEVDQQKLFEPITKKTFSKSFLLIFFSLVSFSNVKLSKLSLPDKISLGIFTCTGPHLPVFANCIALFNSTAIFLVLSIENVFFVMVSKSFF